jgi:hypothetical protein
MQTCTCQLHIRVARVGQDDVIARDANADLVGGALEAHGEHHGRRTAGGAAAAAEDARSTRLRV